MDLFLFLALTAVVFFSSLIGTGAILPMLGARGILDHPNERSSHSTPTPKGGGIVVIACIAVAWAMMATAISSGVRAPMSNPMGAWTCFNRSVETP